jgi:hypothetical protein
MDQRFRWIGLALVLMSIAVGVVAYNAGVSHGLAMSVPAAGGVPAVVNYYGRSWGWGFFPFGILLWVFVLRFLFWGGCGGRRWYYRHGPWGGPYDGPHEGSGTFDDWHRRAHERMNNQPPHEDGPGR